MIKKPQDVVDIVTTRREEIKPLRTRFDSDYELFRLTPYSRGKDYDNYTTNRPRTLAEKIIDLLSDAKVSIRIPIVDEQEEERRAISAGERLIYGCLSMADRRLVSVAEADLQSQMSWHVTLRGWLIPFCFIYKSKKTGETVVDIRIWDASNTDWRPGDNGTLWICHQSWEYRPDLEERWGKKLEKNWVDTAVDAVSFWKKKDDYVLVYNWFDGKDNCVVAANQFLKEPAPHNIGHTPGAVLPCSATPYITSVDSSAADKEYIKDVGESIYAPTRGTYGPRSRLITDTATIVGLGVHNPLVLYSESGTSAKLAESPYSRGAVIGLSTSKGEKIEKIQEPTMPRDALNLLAILEDEDAMGGLPKTAWGTTPFTLSGYAINQLSSGMATKLYPRRKTMEFAYNWVGQEILLQFSKGGFAPIRVHGEDGSGLFFDIMLSSEEIKPDWVVETTLKPKLPQDEMGQMMMARMAKEAELLSDETIAERLLNIQDTDLEEDKKFESWALRLPAIRLRKVAAALVQRGRPDLAKLIMEELARIPPPGVAPGGQPGAAPAEQPGVVPVQTQEESEGAEPMFATGVPPEQMPPEALGRTAELARLAKLGMIRG